MNTPLDVLDLGASTGFLVAYILNKFDQNVRAVAVEANPNLIPVLEDVRNLNDINFDIEDSAYHSSERNVEFNIHNLSVGGSIQRQTDDTVEVPGRNLEDIIDKYGLTEFLCIVDIEGGEADLIRNELHVLEDKCQILIIEFHEGYTEGVLEAKQTLDSSEFEMVENVGGVYVYENQAD